MPRQFALPRSSPAERGNQAQAILDFVAAAEASVDSLHSFMLLQHGSVIAEGWWHPYAAEHPHMMYSVSKSFTSTAVGLAISEGLFALDSRIIDLLPDDCPATIGSRLAALTVRHLLTMTTGHASESLDRVARSANENWARLILAKPIEFEPGTHFVYNSGASYLLSAIVQHLSGEKLLDFLSDRLLAPLGIADATWEVCPRGINTGGWGLMMRTEDLAAFGQLLLQGGTWRDRQIVPAAWLNEATSWQVSNGDPAERSDWTQGYGYQFWRCRNGAFRGDGAFGQYCLVMPEQDAVLVLTGGLDDMQVPLDLVWQHLLPALSAEAEAAADGEPRPKAEAAPEPEATEPAETRLPDRLKSLALQPQPGTPTSPRISEVCGRAYQFPGGGVVSLEDHQLAPVLSWQFGGIHRKLYVPYREWASGATTPYDDSSAVVVASGAWVDEATFVARLRFYESPFENTITLAFDRDQVTVDIVQNVSFGDTLLEHSVGSARPR